MTAPGIKAENGRRVVLAIDDDPDALYLLQESLGEAGYQVVGLSSGSNALEQARQLQPFAITLDIMMPEKDGWQVLHELKSDPQTRAIPVVLVSIVDNQALGFRLGAADYLVKPLNEDAIQAALQRLVESNPGQETRRLLVVDDDPQVIDLITQLLEDSQTQVSAAADGIAALRAIAQEKPDAILLDLVMPHLDGFSVIAHLQADPELRHIPVIVLTAKSLEGSELARLQQGASQVLQKQGLDGRMLVEEINKALSMER
jgi:CheY-like chemotaxis protein